MNLKDDDLNIILHVNSFAYLFIKETWPLLISWSFFWYQRFNLCQPDCHPKVFQSKKAWKIELLYQELTEWKLKIRSALGILNLISAFFLFALNYFKKVLKKKWFKNIQLWSLDVKKYKFLKSQLFTHLLFGMHDIISSYWLHLINKAPITNNQLLKFFFKHWKYFHKIEN